NAGLTQFIAAVTSKRSPLYHQYLQAGAFAARFGPAASTIAAVKSQLRSDGLHVTGVTGDGLLVTFTGSAARIGTAFHTGIASYRLADGRIGQATTSAVRVPSTIARDVVAVVGLDDLVQAQPAGLVRRPLTATAKFPAAKPVEFRHPTGSPTACSVASQDAQAFGGLTDDQIAHAYGAFGEYAAGDLGSGQSIAVYELEPVLASDIDTFDSCYFGYMGSSALEAIEDRLTIGGPYAVDGGQPAGQGSGEAILDVEDVSAIAPGADIDVYEAPNTTFGGLDEYAAIIDNDTAKVVTSSWGLCEQAVQLAEPGLQQAENFLFEQAAAQGQSVFAAEGDTGSDSCNELRYPEPPPGENPLSVLDPASQAYVVSVGGTTISDATQPPTEHVWNDGAEYGAGGGGISMSWTSPTWQIDSKVPGIVAPGSSTYNDANAVETAAGFPTGFCDATASGGNPGGVDPGGSAPCRLVPDVSAQADEFTGAVTVYSTEFGGPFDGWITIGGTSSATPIWAALLALVNASATCTTNFGGAGVGFVSPLLYAVASNPTTYADSFNDVTVGNNDIYGLDDGLVFPATVGYNLASGLGSPDLIGPTGANDGLAFNLCSDARVGDGPTVTSLSPTTLGPAGGSVTITGSGFGSSGSPAISSIQVGSRQITSGIVVNSATSLTATFPPASDLLPPNGPLSQDGTGPANVVVSNTSGQSSPLVNGKTTMVYVDETAHATTPSVTWISPDGASETAAPPGQVKIYGAGFSTPATVTFGGVAATSVTVVSPFEIETTPPAFSGTTSCATQSELATGETTTNDICQTEVQVQEGSHDSTESTILPPYEGATLSTTTMGVPQLPTGCDCEENQQPTEFDYVPSPTITSISTSLSDPPTLASELGDSLITVEGQGFDPLTFNWANFGDPTQESSQDFCQAGTCAYQSGTKIEILAPPNLSANGQPSFEPVSLPFSVDTMAGQSSESPVEYAGVPGVTGVVNETTSRTLFGFSGAADTGGTPIAISGAGFEQVFGPIGFVDADTPYSLGTQYTYDVVSDTSVTTQTVSQNPAVAIVELCTSTGCAADAPGGVFILYPPGNPRVESLSPASGPAHGGTTVDISGANLGCLVSVSFGDDVTQSVDNKPAALDCGSTDEAEVLTPPGKAGTTVKVTVTTAESVFTGATSTSADFAFRPSAPSAPMSLTATAGAGVVSVAWAAPQSAGGSPVTGYRLRLTAPGLQSILFTTAASVRHAKFTTLQAGAQWTVHVAATSSAGIGVGAVATVVPTLGDNGYLVMTASGGVRGFGDAWSHGGIAGEGVTPAGIATTPNALGYWIVTTTGAVTAFGDAKYYGGEFARNVVGIAAAPSGKGYWIVTRDGTVRAFGKVTTYKGTVAKSDVITGIASTPSGRGYWLVASNGKVIAFGDAESHGNAKNPGSSVVGMAPTPSGNGYWLVDSGGQVFAEGGAKTVTGSKPATPVVGMAAAPVGSGYWLVSSKGTVSNYGSAENVGDATSAATIAA
ncbi:MAG TPA: protease pro-enzyme activation domain-containing protein, partial [Acidimicrobiales bacterium]|nr:protease pro-enzyme activation domain-containing protein [Acidimicrobiales bacterium]